jgi:hypothetical protein
MEKMCTKCNVLKDITNYYKVSSKSDKYRNMCKTCINDSNNKYNNKNKERIRELNKIWCQNNKDKRRESNKRRYNEDPEKHKKYHNKWIEKNPNYRKEYKEKNKEVLSIKNKEYRENKKELINEYTRKWYRENSAKVNQRIKQYRKETNYIKVRKKKDPLFRIKTNIRNSIRFAIIKKGYNKRSKTSTILGCTFTEFRNYIESKWEPWMTWENYGLYNGSEKHGWDLDHIIPISSATTEEEVLNLNHYKNFQPLCSFQNRTIKRGLIDWVSNHSNE